MLAIAAFGVAVLPVARRPLLAEEGTIEAGPWQLLRKAPLFWCGLVLLCYITVQGLNPAYEYAYEGTAWWLINVEHIRWLPAGMSVPSEAAPSQAGIVWATFWLTLCAVWAGLRHKRAIALLWTILVANGFFFCTFGIIQRASGTPLIYFTRAVEFPYFFSSIVYKNHAAAFSSLLAFVAIGLIIREWSRSRFDLRRSRVTVVFILMAAGISAGVILSFSAAATALFACGLTLLSLHLVRSKLGQSNHRRRRRLVAVSSIVVGLVLGWSVFVMRERLHERVLSYVTGEGRHSARMRLLAAGSGLKMFRDRWLFGWGAGRFSYGFTKYQREEPELVQWRQLRLRWEHVHNDWLQYLIELGIVGILPIVLCIGWAVRKMTQHRSWSEPVLRPIICGLVLLGVYGFLDFPLQSPAVLVTAGAVLISAIRWGELCRPLPGDPGPRPSIASSRQHR